MKSNNNRRSAMLQSEYIIHIKQIKPWPPSQSLNSLRSLLIQWEITGTQTSGSTTLVVPTLNSSVVGGGEGKIEFNQSFKISITLPRMISIRSNSFKAFQKNCLEFNLYETRRDKVNGVLLASAVIDLSDYGVLEEVLSLNLVLNCKRNFRNVSQPVLYIDIEPVVKKNGLRSSLSMVRNGGGESVLELMSEEYAEEAAVNYSVIDDDGTDGSSSRSSLTVSSSAFEINEDLVYASDEKSFSGVLGTKLKPVSNAEALVDDDVVRTPYKFNKDVGKYTHFQEATNIATKAHQNTTISPFKCHSSFAKNIRIGEFDDIKINETTNSNVECSTNIKTDSSDLSGNDEKSTNAENGRLKHVKSVRSLSSFSKIDTSDRCYRLHGDANTPLRGGGGGERKELSFHSIGKSTIIETKVHDLEQKVKLLESELRVAAAIEIAVYAVVAEHGGSKSKVHTPARRLSRLYMSVVEENSRASAAKSSVSSLVLVAKGCENDVPRLMYWLSNCVVLRSIITLAIGYDELPLSTGLGGEDEEETEKSSSLDDDEFINMPDWSDPHTYTRTLEKLEIWIFCRIIESLWWQTIVPYMQCYEESFNHIHITSLMNSRIDNSNANTNFPVELWNEAFKEVSERLCPLRATMRECGCLPILSKLVIEQCVARLDVSMFNAILRESGDETPTDPVSDPISDPRVLPIPVGKSSFGAGAQLKNAIGNWCRNLNESFNLGEEECIEDDERQETYCTKLFYHLNTLSDLMMLPKDMLLDKSVRKEVCPTLGPQLIKRVLNFHVPDEFCTDLVPVSLLEALDREDSDEAREECIISQVPCTASPPVYSPPPVADSLAWIIGNCETPEVKNNGLLLIRKSYTSDDELDELQSPLRFMLMNGNSANLNRRSVTEDGSGLRYQLLKEVWRSSCR